MTTDVFVILATGSRHHEDANLIGEALYGLIDATTVRTVVIRHGACPSRKPGQGADQIVHEFCESEAAWLDGMGRALVEDPMPAEWDLCGHGCPNRPHRRRKRPGDIFHPGALDDYCPGAGPRRNRKMAAKLPSPDVCVAFPLGESWGTANCMRAAREMGILVKPVRRVGDAA